MVRLCCCFHERSLDAVDEASQARTSSRFRQWSGAYRDGSTLTSAGPSQVLLDHGCAYGRGDGGSPGPAPKQPAGLWAGGSDDGCAGGRGPEGDVARADRKDGDGECRAPSRSTSCRTARAPSFSSFSRARSNRVAPAEASADAVESLEDGGCGGGGGGAAHLQLHPYPQGRQASPPGGVTMFRATGSFLRQRQPGDPLAVALVVVRGSIERTTPPHRSLASLTAGQRVPHHPGLGARAWQSFSTAGEAVRRQREQSRRQLFRASGLGSRADSVRRRADGDGGALVRRPTDSDTVSGGEEDARQAGVALPLPRRVVSFGNRVPSYSRRRQPRGGAMEAAVAADLRDTAYGNSGDKYDSKYGRQDAPDGDGGADRVRAWRGEDDTDEANGDNDDGTACRPPSDDGSANDADCSGDDCAQGRGRGRGRGRDREVQIVGGLAWAHQRSALHSPGPPQSPDTSTSGVGGGGGGGGNGVGGQRWSGRGGGSRHGSGGGGRGGGGGEEEEGGNGGGGVALQVQDSSASQRWRQSRMMRPQRSILKKEDAVTVCRRTSHNFDAATPTTTAAAISAGVTATAPTDPETQSSFPVSSSGPSATSAATTKATPGYDAEDGEPSRPGTPEPVRHLQWSVDGAYPHPRAARGQEDAGAGAAATQCATGSLRVAGMTAAVASGRETAAADATDATDAGSACGRRRGSTDDGFMCGSAPQAQKVSKAVSFLIVVGSQEGAAS